MPTNANISCATMNSPSAPHFIQKMPSKMRQLDVFVSLPERLGQRLGAKALI